MKTHYDSLNTLKLSDAFFRKDSSIINPDTPAAISKNLELADLDDKLFPVLITGISCWPFLTLAFDCYTDTRINRIFSTTNKLRKALQRNGGRNIIGPKTNQSLRPYKSMCKRLQNNKQYEPLYKFLFKLSGKFDGDPKFFTSHGRDVKWRVALRKVNGKQADAYIRARKDAKNNRTVFDVVTQLLSNDSSYYDKTGDKTLWYGAFCYAFLRCLFGYFDNKEEESFPFGDYAVEWKRLLLKIINDKKAPIPSNVKNCSKYRELLGRIEDEESKPPLAEVTKQWRKEDRPVLSGLRLEIFHRLYFNPTPQSILDYLDK